MLVSNTHSSSVIFSQSSPKGVWTPAAIRASSIPSSLPEAWTQTLSFDSPSLLSRCMALNSVEPVIDAWIVVSPRETNSSKTCLSPSTYSSSVYGGNILATRSLALSLRTPVGSPYSSLSIFPWGGSGVSFSLSAAPSARLLATPMCPSLLWMYRGFSGVTPSSSARLG